MDADLSPPSTPDKEGQLPEKSKRRKPLWICVAVVFVVVAIAAIIVAVLISQKIIHVGGNSRSVSEGASASETAIPAESSPAAYTSDSGSGSGSRSGSKTTSARDDPASTTSASPTSSESAEPTETCPTKDDIPSKDQGTYFDTSSWLDMDGFNCSYTKETVGGLPIIGLSAEWDDSARANPTVPPLNKPWGSYASRPIRGVNLGGWLSLEPFITPSLFAYDFSVGIVDEWNLSKYLGKKAAATLEKHYSTFITEQDFKTMAQAGLDHVRIPFSYWAVQVYDDDPYVFQISWRYLLRGIEWARKYGIRVNLDLHGLPGSQNSWNHSGRQGKVNWLTGPDGAANAKRSLDIHDQLSKFFAQDRYKNVVAFYGLANEPARVHDMDALIEWTADAIKVVTDNGVPAKIVFSDALRGLPEWQGKLTGYGDSLVVDTHSYVIFDNALLGLKHTDKITFACKTWTEQMLGSVNTATGFGPTMVGEWSQADTDCTRFLNGVGNGARWIGTFSDSQGAPRCPTGDKQCSCDLTNGDPSEFSADYKLFLKTWAQAQMDAFEKTWGWFYWTWKTESAPLWSYQAGLEAGIMPAKAHDRDWSCAEAIPNLSKLPEFL
ncbi:hypothetical protein ABW20_dc0106283 [Dactylellina cionopaga]|nr:hypothetical protein ABW20_dc0106283 [Dactylellina cionopaga]